MQAISLDGTERAFNYRQSRVGGRWGSGDLLPEKCFRTTPSRMLENALLEDGKMLLSTFNIGGHSNITSRKGGRRVF